MEIWKTIIGHEGYQVSNLSRFRSVDRFVNHPSGGVAKRNGQILKQVNDKDGYKLVNFKKNQKSNTKRVHRIIAQNFIPNPDNKLQVNHINGIKYDNRIENLEWCTLSENRKHAYRTGLQNSTTRQGVKNNFAKLNEIQVKEILKSNMPQRLIGLKYGVSQSCISLIKRGVNWKQIK